VQAKTSLAYVAHLMVWEGIELIPVVGSAHDLQGLVSRQDVLKALNEVQRQPQVGETIHDLSSQGLTAVEGESAVFETDVTPQMTNQIGTLSYGVLTTLISESSTRMLQQYSNGTMDVESSNA